MITLSVDLGERSYPVYIGAYALEHSEFFLPHLDGEQVVIVTDETVGPLYLERLQKTLHGLQCTTVTLPSGEQTKELGVVNQIFDHLLEQRTNRDAALVALGGGVVGDITGFAAACYQRGIAFVQVPTTLLAQVDSSVGGKTGINHRLGKNMIGAFHQPVCVVADTSTLATLEQRQLSAGIAEVIKYGLIRDYAFFEWLEDHMEELVAGKPDAQEYAVKRSCENKAAIVAADERESGVRALLNLGHTFGHAFETGLGYGVWLHGEAVGAGMSLAAELSRRLGWIDQSTTRRIQGLIARARLPIHAPARLPTQSVVEMMSVDKKVIGGRMRLVLLKAIGEAILTDDFDPAALVATLSECTDKGQTSTV